MKEIDARRNKLLLRVNEVEDDLNEVLEEIDTANVDLNLDLIHRLSAASLTSSMLMADMRCHLTYELQNYTNSVKGFGYVKDSELEESLEK